MIINFILFIGILIALLMPMENMNQVKVHVALLSILLFIAVRALLRGKAK